MTAEHLDVLIIGAGLSGIGAGCRLTLDHPERSFAILESRAASGGTWDLFRYPGVRSDSDMYTLGYRFRPWTGAQALADGAAILDYVRETATAYGVDETIRYGHRVLSADFSSEDQRWVVSAEADGEPVTITADVLWCCSGYYDYDQGFQPEFAGVEDFRGHVVHPQHWPEDLDVTGKRVVVIGSGATAVTLVPALAGTASHVTMLQRSPTYILSMPNHDPVVAAAERLLPEKVATGLSRWKSVLQQTALYQLARKRPDTVRRMIRSMTVRMLPDGYDVDTHFKPTYDPWDQRLCLVPDGDLFKVLRKGQAEMVTDRIDTFTSTGIRLESGRELEADVVVSATGLNLKLFGGITLAVDGEKVEASEHMAYRGMMLAGVPNYVFTIGYTNASWTLKADLVAEYVMKVLTHLDESGTRSFVPVADPGVGEERLFDFDAGYVLRSADLLPPQGDVEPWRLRQNYVRDKITLGRAKADDGVLTFT